MLSAVPHYCEPEGDALSGCWWGRRAGDQPERPSYRYLLWRVWGSAEPARVLLWLMLNPSTADVKRNDPTVERCERRSRALGFDGFMVCNLFALRSTSPHVLRSDPWPIGPNNDLAILAAADRAAAVVCAWGAWGQLNRRGLDVLEMLRGSLPGKPLLALGWTEKSKSPQPRHPLYVSYEVPLVPVEAIQAPGYVYAADHR